MQADTALLFFSTSVLLALVPGPDNIFVLTQSLSYGSRAGWMVVLGLCSGLVLHTILIAAGLAALIAASSHALLIIKVIGAAYLLYLAWQSWLYGNPVSTNKPSQSLSRAQLYRRGIIMNTTNPKVLLFFLAFLPQFVDVAQGNISAQILLLGLLFIAATIIVFGGIAQLAGRYSESLNQSSGKRILLNRMVSLVFVLLALNLLVGLF